MPSQYDDEIKAQAQALIRQGRTAVSVARTLQLPERTVSYWAHNWRQIAVEEEDRELLDGEYRVAAKARGLILDALDVLSERDVDDLPRHLFVLNALKGTSVDKILRRKEIEKPSSAPIIPVQIILHSPRPEITDGEN